MRVAVEELAGGQVHGHGAPRATLVGVRNGGLLGGDADQLVEAVVVAEGDGEAAHHGPVARRRPGIGIAGQPPGLERIGPSFDLLERPLRGEADAPPVDPHPPRPPLRDVAGVEVTPLHQRLGEQQGHSRVVVERRSPGRGGEVANAARKRRADRLRGAESLGGHAELVARHETEQRSARAREQLGVGPRATRHQYVRTTTPLRGATRAANPCRSV